MADAAAIASPRSRLLGGIAGTVLLLVAWQVIGASQVFGSSISSLTAVLEVWTSSDASVIVQAALTTAREALTGFVGGGVVALLASALVVLVPVLRRGVDQLATISSAIPYVALAPVLLGICARESIPAAMAAISVFFPIYISAVNGLTSVPAALNEVFTVFGGARRQRMLRAQLPTALPVLTSGLKIAMPLSIVGAVIGEWFGASNGIGPLLLTSMRSYRMPTMWAAVTGIVVIALVLYGLASLAERVAARRFG